ncbi:MAG: 4-(cytidine 5'-diphospho)-2-C-methyl-D-erythritol kinase [Candidatus Eisenbacteria bacterium]
MLAYAKVNLGLRVGPKRPDGYHEVRTTLCAISLHDALVFAPRAHGFTLSVDGPEARGVPRTRGNLVLRAAHALAAELGETSGAAIRLTKRVPHGAGLGGGSSDAAATLRGLALLWRRRVPRARLAALGATLGSDVPFFLGPSPAFATGRGERLTPLARLIPALRFVIVVPRVAISTGSTYGRYTIPKSRLTEWKRVARLLQLRPESVAVAKFKRNFSNDLEQVVLPRTPAVREAFTALRASGVEAARMSGSGSAVFGISVSARAQVRAFAELSSTGHRVFVARSMRAGSRPRRG